VKKLIELLKVYVEIGKAGIAGSKAGRKFRERLEKEYSSRVGKAPHSPHQRDF
jgi:hypothetical protein